MHRSTTTTTTSLFHQRSQTTTQQNGGPPHQRLDHVGADDDHRHVHGPGHRAALAHLLCDLRRTRGRQPPGCVCVCVCVSVCVCVCVRVRVCVCVSLAKGNAFVANCLRSRWPRLHRHQITASGILGRLGPPRRERQGETHIYRM